jgi:hypothetical protein
MLKTAKKRGRRRKCDATNVKANTSIQFSDNKPEMNSGGKTFSFGGMNIIVENGNIDNLNVGSSDQKKSNKDLGVDLSLCKIDIPDRIVVKHKRKPRKRIIEDSDRIFKVLSQFVKDGSGSDWPESSELLCWWCCHSFDGSPKCVPTNYNNSIDQFKVTGNFCSWNCSKAFVINERPKQISNLTRLIQHIHGFVPFINPAPPRYILKSFGGTMDIVDFRKGEDLFEVNKANIVMDETFYVKTT